MDTKTLTFQYPDPVDQDLIKLHAKAMAGAALTPADGAKLLGLLVDLRSRVDAIVSEATSALNEGYQS